MSKQSYVYIMTNYTNRVLYTGVTSDLKKRVYQHKEGVIPGFTKRYNVKKLVYYETYFNIISAITREKQIKKWKRQKKIDLVNSRNPEWKEIYEEL